MLSLPSQGYELTLAEFIADVSEVSFLWFGDDILAVLRCCYH